MERGCKLSVGKSPFGSIGKTRLAEEWLINMMSEPTPTGFQWSNIGTSYSEVAETPRVEIDFGKIPATQIKLYFRGKDSEGTGDIELYDVTNSQQLVEITNLGTTTAWHESAWTDLPANVIGTEITLTIRVKGSATEDILFSNMYIKLRRA